MESLKFTAGRVNVDIWSLVKAAQLQDDETIIVTVSEAQISYDIKSLDFIKKSFPKGTRNS